LAVEIRTGRGLYRLVEAAPAATGAGASVLTLALERADGIERVVFRCRIDHGLLSAGIDAEMPGNLNDGQIARDQASAAAKAVNQLITRLQAWVEREFEMIREAALKSIRSERKLYEVAFDNSNRGPF
jgi:hypothetical protein